MHKHINVLISVRAKQKYVIGHLNSNIKHNMLIHIQDLWLAITINIAMKKLVSCPCPPSLAISSVPLLHTHHTHIYTP